MNSNKLIQQYLADLAKSLSNRSKSPATRTMCNGSERAQAPSQNRTVGTMGTYKIGSDPRIEGSEG